MAFGYLPNYSDDDSDENHDKDKKFADGHCSSAQLNAGEPPQTTIARIANFGSKFIVSPLSMIIGKSFVFFLPAFAYKLCSSSLL